MDLYFKRHDGQAVTCDDFLAAMADANGQDLSTVARWSVSSSPGLGTHCAGTLACTRLRHNTSNTCCLTASLMPLQASSSLRSMCAHHQPVLCAMERHHTVSISGSDLIV